MASRFRAGLRGLLQRRTLERSMDDELTLHIELRAADLERQGLPMEEAMRQARREFGNVTATKERAREAWVWTSMEQVVQDVRYAARGLRRSPMFTAAAVLSLGLGIGTNTAIFGLVYSVLLARLPLPHADELVMPIKASERTRSEGFSYGEYRSLAASPGLSGATAVFGMSTVAIEVGNDHADASIDFVTGPYFSVLGLRAARGRGLTENDERAVAPVVVISDEIWQTHFSGAADVLGRTMKIGGTPFTVVGVLPKNYHGLSVPDGDRDLTVPLSVAPLVGAPDVAARRIPALLIVARLAAAGSGVQTGASMDAIYQRCCAAGQMAARAKNVAGGERLSLQDISRGIVSPKFDFRAMFARVLLVLMGAVSVVLLIVCANVGSLLLGRATSRRRELAVRLSLGASRGRLGRQLFGESLLLALLGAGLGLLLASWGTRVLAHNLPGVFASLSELVALRLNAPILGFTAAASVFAVLVFGTLPAWRATRTDLISPLKEGSRGNARSPVGVLERGIIVVQVALTLVLVAASGLLVATLRNLQTVDPGFATTGIVSAWLDTRDTPLADGGVAPIAQELLTRLRTIPGVRAAALSLAAPVLGGRRQTTQIAVPGYAPTDDVDVDVAINMVTPEYFTAMGIALRSGRPFSDGDGLGALPVAIVNQAFVNRYVSRRQPLGSIVQVGLPTGPTLQIVGVVGDARYTDLRVAATPMVYRPLEQAGHQEVTTLVLRTAGDPSAVGAAVRNGITGVAPRLRIRSMGTIDDAMKQALARERLSAALAGVFGAIALALAVVGLYGVVSYNVARRTNEIGIRMALGARQSDVIWSVVRHSLGLVALGVCLGLPLAFAAGRTIASLLWGVGAHDPVLLAGSVLLLAAAAIAASVVPALRAALVDPLIALRAE